MDIIYKELLKNSESGIIIYGIKDKSGKNIIFKNSLLKNIMGEDFENEILKI